MKVEIKLNDRDVKRMLARLNTEAGELAVKRTINRTADQARTRMSREIRDEFALTKAKVDQKLHVQAARVEGGGLRFTGRLLSYGERGRRSINLIAFAARQSKRNRMLSAQILRAKGRIKVPGAFIGNQGRTVFRRVGRERLPIKTVQVIDVPQMFNTRRINEKVLTFVRQKFPEVYQRELRFALRQAGARVG